MYHFLSSFFAMHTEQRLLNQAGSLKGHPILPLLDETQEPAVKLLLKGRPFNRADWSTSQPL